MRGWKKVFHEDGNQRKAGVTILISEKNRLENKDCKKRQGTLHNDQWINLTEDITIVNIYALNIGAPKYIK